MTPVAGWAAEGTLSFIAREAGIFMILGNLMYVQIFLTNANRGRKELSTHYIYMMPERAFSKMLWNNAETMLKTIVESAILFSIAALIAGFALGEQWGVLLGLIILAVWEFLR